MKTSTLLFICVLMAAYWVGACGDKTAESSSGSAVTGSVPSTPVASAPNEPARVARKMFLFALDGATWTLMDPLLAQGKLPHFTQLIDNGVRGPLKTFKPTASPIIWTSIATGVGPAKHGISDFTVKIPGSQETLLPTSNMRRVKALWNIVSENDFSVGVVGWWASYPAETVNGFVISDQASTLRTKSYETALHVTHKTAPLGDRRETFPVELDGELEDIIAKSPGVGVGHLTRFMKLSDKEMAEVSGKEGIDIEDIRSAFKVAMLIDQAFIASSVYAIEKYKPDVAMVYLNGLDAAEHHFWKFMEPDKFANVSAADTERFGKLISEYYIYMDEVLGIFMDLYRGREQELTVIVVSDHGHEANLAHDPNSEQHYDRVCSGGHEEAPDGIIIMSGKDIVAGGTIDNANVLDIAPTGLGLMGIPVGADMPGRVLREGIRPGFFKDHPVSKIPTHSADRTFSDTPVPSPMGDALKEKLKGLGYIQ